MLRGMSTVMLNSKNLFIILSQTILEVTGTPRIFDILHVHSAQTSFVLIMTLPLRVNIISGHKMFKIGFNSSLNSEEKEQERATSICY